MDLSDITLEDLVDAIADRLAEKLGTSAAPAARRGGPAAETDPPTVDDADADEAPNKDNPADEVEPEDEGEADADDDLVTKGQLKFVDENYEKKSADDMRTELAEFYESYGDDPEDVANEVASLKGAKLTNAYKDYMARLVTHKPDGTIDDFLSDWEEPYRALRITDGEEKLVWVKAGLTLTEEEFEEAGLPDPSDDPDAKKGKRKTPSRTRKPAGRKKK